MQKKATFWVMMVGVLGVLLGVAQSACAGLVVVGVKTGSGDPWTYDSSAWGPLAVHVEGGGASATGPGWYSQDSGGLAEAQIDIVSGGSDWTKYLANPGSDPGVDVTLYELIQYVTGVGAPTIDGWNMVSQSPGWEFVNNTGLAGKAGDDLTNADGSSGVRGATTTGTIYDYAFDSAEVLGEGTSFRLAVDLRWVGGGTPPAGNIVILQTACLSTGTLPCTASGGSTPPTPGTPIPATPALLVIGLMGMGMRRRRRS